jgi:hypothetical protein
MTDRLSELEAKAAAITAEIAALKSGKSAPLPQVKDDEGARVIELLHERTADMPNLEQLRKLYNIVRHKVPQVKVADDDAPFRGFCGAFRYVSNCGRVAAPNNKHSLGWWGDDMKFWLRARNAMTNDVTGASFIAAVMASGDVLFVPHDGNLGNVWEFSLVPPGHGGKPATDAWRLVLGGSVLGPSAPARRMAPPSPVRIYGGY